MYSPVRPEMNKRPRRVNARSMAVSQILKRSSQSHLVGFVLLLTISTFLFYFSDHFQPLTFIHILPIGFLLVAFKKLVFEIFLISHIIGKTFGNFHWYDLVDDDLYLGALPLDEDLHELSKKLNINSILSVVEPFELITSTIAGRPVNTSEWKSVEIQQHQLSSPDFFPPSLDLLDRGADYLNTQLSEGKKVYVHCKSGKGRSASMIMAYWIKYKNMDPIVAHTDLKIKRPFVFGRNSPQMKNLIQYSHRLRPKKTDEKLI